MKISLIILSVVLISFIVFQSFIMRNTAKTEEQKYIVLEKDGNFEIRYYPKVVMATVLVPGTTFDKISSPGFRKLAGYIFGGNKNNESIAMTSPVHMEVNDTVGSMSFVMPSSYDVNSLPAPNDSGIKIHVSDEEYAAVIKYGGYSSDKDIKKYTTQLQEFLDKKHIKTIGLFRYLGYNPPYQMVDRRNELIVKIEYVANKPQ